jgi:CheY-like chemotaxis protein
MIVDAVMPGKDGFALAREAAKLPEGRPPTVMLLNTSDLANDIPRCRKLGIACHITKPVYQADLRRAMLRALGSTPSDPRVADEAASQSLRRLSILLAEDNPTNQKLATRLLEKRGHSITTVGNGRDAIEALSRNDFDLVLMDVQMPVMDGWKATEVIRHQEQDTGRHIPILALTAHAMKDYQERCYQAGMDGFLTKPFRPAQLYEAVESAVADT